MEDWRPGNFLARKRACSLAEVGSDWCSQSGAISGKDLTIRASTRCFSSCQFHGPGHWRNTSVACIVITTESERLSCTTTSTEPCPCWREGPRSPRRAAKLWDSWWVITVFNSLPFQHNFLIKLDIMYENSSSAM